jgi:hypothetical protein
MVLIPGDTSPDDVEATVDELLAPYDEGIDVPEYEKECHCIGRIARRESEAAASRKFGSWEKVRQRFHRRKDVKKLDPFSDESTELWKEFTGPRTKFEDDFFKKHPDAKKAEKDCYDCHGSGVRTTAYNPKSKWDWYEIGGRWTGTFVECYDPEKDPANIEVCYLCNGTGKRRDLGKRAKKCNGCDGKGKATKWPTQWKKFKADVMPVKFLPESKEIIPFAIVTPDGEWHEKGEMGWFGMARDEKPLKDWFGISMAILNEHQDCLAVVVDCHI